MKPMVYIDMDGVLAGLYKDMENRYGIPYQELTEEDYREQHINYRIFKTLTKTKIADTLIAKTVQLFGSYSILSTPFGGFEEECIDDKVEWIRNNLAIKPRDMIFTKYKHEYAEDNILIDDYRKNLEKWELFGGYGIKCKDGSDKHGLDYALGRLEHHYFTWMELA